MSFLSVKNLHVVLGGEVIVDHVSFDVAKGQTVAIIGPNGSGKTTLFRAILNLVPYTGEIRWAETPRIGYVPQRLQFDRTFPMTVEELFLLKTTGSFWRDRGASHDKITKALEEVGVVHRIHYRLGTLSSGEFQRVLIAYALFEDPNVLLFDEPTSGVDAGGETTIYELLHHIAQERQLTMLLISHDLNVIYHFADMVICLNHTMTCYGVPREVLTPEQLSMLYHGKHDEHTKFYTHDHHRI